MNAVQPTVRRRLCRQSFPRSGRARSAWIAELALIFVLAAVIVHQALRTGADASGIVKIADHEVAVVTDLWSGEQRAVLTPGYELVMPRIEVVHKLDKSPVQYVMRGDVRSGPNQVPMLVARARDGSVFWFDRIEIQYGLDVRQLDVVLQDSGPGDGFRSGLMDALAPSVLLDELGRFGPEEVASPQSLQAATSRAQERLNALLAAHGIEVYEIALSKPSFDERYEETIERREVAEQEMQSLRQQAELMQKAQPASLAEMVKKKELELEKLTAKWRAKLTELEKEAERLRAGRPEELAQLEQYKLLALEKARAEWRAELGGIEKAALELEQAAARRIVEAERLHAIELEAHTEQGARELAASARAGEQLGAAHAARLEALRRAKRLEFETLRSDLATELQAVRALAQRELFEAESYRETRQSAGEAERDAQLAEGRALERRLRGEHETFLARAEAFAARGPTAVRAALVDRMRTILFEIAPFGTPAGAENPPTRKAAARIAAGSQAGVR